MYRKFSQQAKGIIIRSHRYAINQNEYVVGSEFLLLSLYNEPNSSCQILLKEQNITEEQIIKEIININVFRKNIPGLIIYTPKFRLILDKALEISKKTKAELVYEEHLFLALLNTPNCIAIKILENLNINILQLAKEIIDVMGWEFNTDDENIDLINNFNFVENITTLVQKKKLLPLIGRKDILKRIINILNKRNKRNVLLIGNAGVGKSAIVEGLAQKYYQENKDIQIISLNVTSLIAGTKYRGDFEQRIKEFLDYVKNKKNIIVFIDEIHNIINIGNNDNNLDIANILKPSLARGEINCIGATTINEYYKYIANDQALSRRFLPIFVDEPTVEDTIHILLNIKHYFEEFHKVLIPANIITFLCHQVEKTIVDRYFPDKAIDILDEACSYAKLNNKRALSYNDIDHIIKTINNQKINEQIIEKIEKFPFLKKYFLRYYSNIKISYQPILSILCYYQNEIQLTKFIEELAFIFNVGQEAIKKINLNNYTNEHSIANLIGSPPGYVGFDNPNTLTKFVQKYPRTIIVLNNIDSPAQNIRQLIHDILNSGYIEDLASNKIYFTNTIIIATRNTYKHSIGFLNLDLKEKSHEELKFNEVINLNKYITDIKSNEHNEILEKYLIYFKNNNIDLNINNLDEIKDLQDELEALLFECLFKEKKQRYSIDYDKIKRSFYIKK